MLWVSMCQHGAGVCSAQKSSPQAILVVSIESASTALSFSSGTRLQAGRECALRDKRALGTRSLRARRLIQYWHTYCSSGGILPAIASSSVRQQDTGFLCALLSSTQKLFPQLLFLLTRKSRKEEWRRRTRRFGSCGI